MVGGTTQSPGRVEGPSWRTGSGRGTLPEVWDGSEDPPGGPGQVGDPTGGLQRSGDHPNGPGRVRGTSHKCRRGGVGRGREGPSVVSVGVGRAPQSFRRGQDGPPEVRKGLGGFRMSGRGREGSGGPSGGQEGLSEVWEGSGRVRRAFQRSGGPSRGPGGVRRAPRRSGRGREGLRRSGRAPRRSGRTREGPLEVREGLRGPPGGPGGVGRVPQRSGRGREGPPEVREASESPCRGGAALAGEACPVQRRHLSCSRGLN